MARERNHFGEFRRSTAGHEKKRLGRTTAAERATLTSAKAVAYATYMVAYGEALRALQVGEITAAEFHRRRAATDSEQRRAARQVHLDIQEARRLPAALAA